MYLCQSSKRGTGARATDPAVTVAKEDRCWWFYRAVLILRMVFSVHLLVEF